MWGAKVSAYLFTKSLAAGGFLAPLTLLFSGSAGKQAPKAAWHWAWGGGLLFLGLTLVLLVLDLKRPERFWYMLRHPQWKSWLVRGSVILGAYGALLALCFLLSIGRGLTRQGLEIALIGVTAVCAALTAMYTAWLFGQAKGRVLWMRRHLAAHLLVQAFVAGSALLLLSGPALPWTDASLRVVRYTLLVSLVLHGLFTLFEEKFAPAGREAEYARVSRLVTHGTFARRHWSIGVAVGITVPIVGLLLTAQPITGVIIAAMALFGLWTEEDILVRAGQAVPIS